MFVSTLGRTRVSGVNQRATRQEFRIGGIRFIAACIVDSFIFKMAARGTGSRQTKPEELEDDVEEGVSSDKLVCRAHFRLTQQR